MANNLIKFLKGTQSNYDALKPTTDTSGSPKRDADTVYVCTDSSRLFIGDKEYSRPLTIGHGIPSSSIAANYPLNSLYFNDSDAILYYTDGSTWWEIYNYENLVDQFNRRAESFHGVCSTDAATVVKNVTCSTFETIDLKKGTLLFVTFDNTNSGAVADLKMTVNGQSVAANGAGDPIKKHYGASVANLSSAGELRANETYLFAHDGTNWVCLTLNYNSNDNTISTTMQRLGNGQYSPIYTTLYRYQLLLTSANDSSKLIPLNSTSNNQTTAKTTITTEEFNIFEPIFYYSTTTAVSSGSLIGASYLWYAHNAITLKYSFNTGETLTANRDVYLVAEPSLSGDGMTATLRNPGATGANASAQATGDNAGPITQTLPTTQDGYIYIKLGHAYSTYQINMFADHPVYWFIDGALRLYDPNYLLNRAKENSLVTTAIGNLDVTEMTNTASKTLATLSETDGKISATFQDISIVTSQISDFPTSLTPTSHSHGNIANGGTISSTAVALANGDALLFADSSNSGKIEKSSITFDGSTATKALTQKGTWETFVNSSGVTSITIQTTSPLSGGSATATTTTGTYTLSLADAYGDTKNPYGSKTKNYVLAAPSNAAGAPTFRALVADDIPALAWSKITSGNDDLKAIEALSGTTGFLKKTAANTWTLDTNSYVTSSGVTSITIKTTSPLSGGSDTATTSTGTYTLSLADGYGDTKNPYTSKTKNYVLAAPDGSNGAPVFRALVAADIPNLAWSKITSGNDDLKAIEALTGTSGFLKKTAANTWTLDTGSYKPTQTAITKPTEVTNQWISAIGQDANGVISVDYATLDTSGSWTGDAASLTTARTLSISDTAGGTAPTFDGSADVTLSTPATMTGFTSITSTDFVGNVTGNVTGYTSNILYGTCSTAAGTAAKEVVLSGITLSSLTLTTGMLLGVKFTNANSVASPTITLKSGTTSLSSGVAIVRYGTTAVSTSAATSWRAGAMVLFVYDGTRWVESSSIDDNTTYYYTSAYCTTGAATAAKTATISGAQELTAGKHFQVWIYNTNTAASALTLNVSSKGAKPIYINGTASSASNYTLPRGAYIVYYDGDHYHFRTDGILPGPVEKVAHTLTFGNGTYTFDGSEDITVPIYDGSWS